MNSQSRFQSQQSISITAADSDNGGLVVRDWAERDTYRISTEGAVSPTTVATSRIDAPLDTVVRITTSSLTFIGSPSILVHAPNGTITDGREEQIWTDTKDYVIELDLQAKFYLKIRGPFSLDSNARFLTVELPERAEVYVGARSRHTRPIESVQTTSRPEDIMKAVSTFGASLKTLSCERSYPTLRGHPPSIQLGDELKIPSNVNAPDTSLYIECPPELGPIYSLSPLAFYLGCELKPSDTAQIVTENGGRFALQSHDKEIHELANQTLNHILFMDCIVRTEDERPWSLKEREHIEDELEFSPEALYGTPFIERLPYYFTVDYETIRPHIPNWRLNATVQTTADVIPSLPYLAYGLAEIKPLDPQYKQTLAGPLQSNSTERGSKQTFQASTFPAEQQRHTWVGDGILSGASKLIPKGYENNHSSEHSKGPIKAAVVCNDEKMLSEHQSVNDIYADETPLPYEIASYESLTTEKMRLLIESNLDFLHFIGHIDNQGIKCKDGYLDPADIDATGVDVFLLNACNSYRVGVELINKGAVGGVVTLEDVLNDTAVNFGKTLAELFEDGFSISNAVGVANNIHPDSSEYLVIGQLDTQLKRASSFSQSVSEITQTGDSYNVEMETFINGPVTGGMYFAEFIGNKSMQLAPDYSTKSNMDKSELETYLTEADDTIIYDGELIPSNQYFKILE
jgi:hypothetical protein